MTTSETGSPAPLETSETPSLSRRGALGLAGMGLGAAAFGAARAVAQAPVAPLPPTPPNLARDIRGELQPLAPNVYAYIQREAPGQSNLSVSNCGVVVGDKANLAIDATSAPAHAKRFLEASRRVTGNGFDRCVITHMHGDHTLGLQFLGDNVECVAQEECAIAMSLAGSGRPGTWDPKNPAWSDGTETFIKPLADVTYSERMTLFGYKPRQVQFLWPQRSHTLGDTNVYLPDEKVIFIGDNGFFGVTPMNGSGYIARWIKVCDEILAMDVKSIVPGHGPVGGKAELEDMKQYLVLLYTEVKARFDRGIPPGVAAAEINLGKYSTWADSDRILLNTVRLYSELAGTISASVPPTAVPTARTDYNRVKGIK